MTTPSQKRTSPADESEESPIRKRQRTSSSQTIWKSPPPAPDVAARPAEVVPSIDEQARGGLQRSIALALQHVGFQGASKEALNSLTSMTETCKELVDAVREG